MLKLHTRAHKGLCAGTFLPFFSSLCFSPLHILLLHCTLFRIWLGFKSSKFSTWKIQRPTYSRCFQVSRGSHYLLNDFSSVYILVLFFCILSSLSFVILVSQYCKVRTDLLCHSPEMFVFELSVFVWHKKIMSLFSGLAIPGLNALARGISFLYCRTGNKLVPFKFWKQWTLSLA